MAPWWLAIARGLVLSIPLTLYLGFSVGRGAPSPTTQALYALYLVAWLAAEGGHRLRFQRRGR